MKKFLVLATCLAAVASIASANTIVFGCSQISSPVPPANGAGSSSCGGFTGGNAVPGGATINFVRLDYGIDFSFNSTLGITPAMTFSFTTPNAGFFGTNIALPPRPNNNFIQVAGAGAIAGLTGPFNINATWTANNPPITNVTADFTWTVDYTPEQTGVPEPSTFALLGVGLVAAGLFRRR